MSKNGGKKTSVPRNVNDSANIPTMQKIHSGNGIGRNSANVPTMQQAPGTQSTSQGGGGSNSGSESSSNTNSGSDKK